jgi:hypothetical protein
MEITARPECALAPPALLALTLRAKISLSVAWARDRSVSFNSGNDVFNALLSYQQHNTVLN